MLYKFGEFRPLPLMCPESLMILFEVSSEKEKGKNTECMEAGKSDGMERGKFSKTCTYVSGESPEYNGGRSFIT